MTDSLHARVARAVRAHSEGRLSEAARLLDAVLQHRAQDPGLHFNRAMVALDQADLPTAHRHATRLAALAPTDPSLPSLSAELGVELARTGHFEDAAPWLAQAPADHPDAARWRAHVAPPDWLPRTLPSGLQPFTPRESRRYVWTFDVVGTCNLACPTCPVGNSPPDGRPRGFMTEETFTAALDHALSIHGPDQSTAWFFSWGEPLLHPRLPSFIRTAKDRGLPVFLSTNLNVEKNLKKVLLARPDQLKVSLSGFTPERYGRTHRRGSLRLVQANLYLLAHLRDRHRIDTHIYVGHHLYRSNRADQAPVRALCESLGFEYAPVPAFYMPVERLVDMIEGRRRPDPILADLPVHPVDDTPHRLARRAEGYDCELRFGQTVIQADGSVALCCASYDAQHTVAQSFVHTDFQALEQARCDAALCRSCTRHGLDAGPRQLARRG